MPLSEKLLIERIRRAARASRQPQGRGIGDDCAVLELPRGHEALVTTDFSLEGDHFRREWHPPDSVGHRCLARGLSDIAAMGGDSPRGLPVAGASAERSQQSGSTSSLRGLLKLAQRYSVSACRRRHGAVARRRARRHRGARLGSGRTSHSSLRRARPVIFIYVTGTLGSSVATLERAARRQEAAPEIASQAFLSRAAHRSRAIPAREEAGLGDDRHQRRTLHRPGHICDESEAGAVVYAERCRSARLKEAWTFALHGGEEYELLFTAPPNRAVPKQIAGVAVTRIGEITRGQADEARHCRRQDRSV